MQPRPPQHPIRVALQLSILAVLVVGALNYQALLDQYALATFKPGAEVSAIEGRIGLATRARALFYRSRPVLDEKAQFNTDCETKSHELELGCYYRAHIYVLKIDNVSLAPEMDVVAAHELLHAAWARMSAADRKTIGDELTRVYNGLGDNELKQRMAGYSKSEPGEETNELHSILGTEFGSLSPKLETHYAQFFLDRSRIVAAHQSYQDVFDSRRLELEQELAQIRSLKGRLGVLNQQMQGYRSRGQIGQYNDLVPQQNNLVDDINQRIETYHLGVEEYNALSKSLDSQQITDTETPAQ